MADPLLAPCVSIIDTQLPGTGQSREYTMLPIESLAGWLTTIKRAAPAVQDKLNEYRREAYHALDVWFRGGLRD